MNDLVHCRVVCGDALNSYVKFEGQDLSIEVILESSNYFISGGAIYHLLGP